jgi:hypothetical protein
VGTKAVLLGGAVVYTYDAKDRIAEFSWNDPDGSLFARFADHYDDRGFMVERIWEGGDGDASRETFVYDERGNLAMEVDFRLSAGSATAHPSFKWTYTYNNKGLLVETAYYNLTDGIEECTGKGMNIYDPGGKLVGLDSYDGRGSLTYTERYDGYEFDSHGNGIKRVASRLIREGDRMRREADQSIYRTISYY